MTKSINKDPLLSSAEAAGYLGCAAQTLAAARSTGQGGFSAIPYVKMGHSVRYRQSSLDRYIDESTVTPDSPSRVFREVAPPRSIQAKERPARVRCKACRGTGLVGDLLCGCAAGHQMRLAMAQ